mmetsp:Transcript_25458/g.32544  ORF Transcript_25458/g.32544 Transcript_25458/m.32544 type:complete len:162 (-) Transcript_25458:88-573(-)|eukprot:CAMPEP_0184445568 /NCGR_PEP_ID=MMETSP0740-20130409/2228_1 /TAXON_ID=385413 /ORGANISM="Thalassiosira miniscula, Strain CCMP1093" /LENGTH=161 /DNA_ID=CAMNT_0026814623 /DNA_START=40 /DNA_END=525 /DNA_ORIENTATION=+
MKAITQITNFFLFVLSLLANDASANAGKNEKNTFKLPRALQTEACSSEDEAFNDCIGESMEALSCGLCALAMIDFSAIVTDGAMNDASANGTEEFCSVIDCASLHTCVTESCPESCLGELFASVNCGLKESGCDACSPAFKAVAKATIASFAGAFMGWMLI